MRAHLRFHWFFFAVAAVLAPPAWCAGLVDAVQFPAWLERTGIRVALEPGTRLLAGDVLTTGAGARIQLALDEGSIVQLGQNARFTIEQARATREGPYRALLDVAVGAFRFTTRALSRTRQREINVRLARNATIGVRGTDFWGRGTAGQDMVCLIEGKIDITGNDASTRRLDQPLQLFQSAKDAPPGPLVTIQPEELRILASETDLAVDEGARADGAWKVASTAYADADATRAARTALRRAGYPVRSEGLSVALPGIASEAAARSIAAAWQLLGVSDARAMRMR